MSFKRRQGHREHHLFTSLKAERGEDLVGDRKNVTPSWGNSWITPLINELMNGLNVMEAGVTWQEGKRLVGLSADRQMHARIMLSIILSHPLSPSLRHPLSFSLNVEQNMIIQMETWIPCMGDTLWSPMDWFEKYHYWMLWLDVSFFAKYLYVIQFKYLGSQGVKWLSNVSSYHAFGIPYLFVMEKYSDVSPLNEK